MFKLNHVLDFLLPRLCLLCANKAENTLDLCRKCAADLPYLTHACQRCALPLNNPEQICGRCLKIPPAFDECYAVFCYQQPISHLITACKFKQKLIYTQLLGQLMAKFLAAKLTVLPELIVPIPLHKERLAQRGYNQALEIARPLSRAMHVPINYRCCKRTKNTQAQTGLARKKRRQNLKNAFDLWHDISAQNIAIIDDVMTTGSTANELAKVFKSYGVQHVQVWCCARATWH